MWNKCGHRSCFMKANARSHYNESGSFIHRDRTREHTIRAGSILCTDFIRFSFPILRAASLKTIRQSKRGNLEGEVPLLLIPL
jgi:hypothetical protein